MKGRGQMEVQETEMPGVRATEGRAGGIQGDARVEDMEDCHLDIWQIREPGRRWWGGYPAGWGGE